jgi:hypothetical protein
MVQRKVSYFQLLMGARSLGMAGEVATRWAGRGVSSDMMAVEGGVRSVAFSLLVVSLDSAEGTA